MSNTTLMMYFKYFYIFVIINNLFYAFEAVRKRPYSLEIHNITCTRYTKHLKRLECEINNISPGRYNLTVLMEVSDTLDKETDFHAIVRVKPFRSKNAISFVDLKVDLCTTTSDGVGNALLDGLMMELLRTSNFPLTCPFVPNFLYKIENYTLTNEFFPVFAPFLNATFRINLEQESQIIADLVVEAALIPKK